MELWIVTYAPNPSDIYLLSVSADTEEEAKQKLATYFKEEFGRDIPDDREEYMVAELADEYRAHFNLGS